MALVPDNTLNKFTAEERKQLAASAKFLAALSKEKGALPLGTVMDMMSHGQTIVDIGKRLQVPEEREK